MTPDAIKRKVEHIDAIKGDDESAHSAEDGLYADVLQAIADGSCEDPAACAAEALKTADIDFERWCA